MDFRNLRFYAFLKLVLDCWMMMTTEAVFFASSGLLPDGLQEMESAAAVWVQSELELRRRKRYVISKEKWPSKTLRWKLHKNRLNNADLFIIRATLHRAFDIWASASSLKFVEVSDLGDEYSDIDILFLKGKHGDGLPFDGPMGIVAHAFYPPVGALHFDADENWTLNREDGINFYQTAVHEIGHLLGLEHSTDYRAVMYPRNRKFEIDFQLADDDVRGIRRLYPVERKKS